MEHLASVLFIDYRLGLSSWPISRMYYCMYIRQNQRMKTSLLREPLFGAVVWLARD